MTKFRILPVNSSKVNIGILGGSFNPAHEGHIYISKEAIKRCNLQKIVWLVTPQNPIKQLDIRDSLEKRISLAKKYASNSKIQISAIEKHFHNTYTANSLKRLKLMHPGVNFVWIMGADNIPKFHKWYKWKWILNNFDVLIFDREDNHRLLNRSRLGSYKEGAEICKSKVTFNREKKSRAFIKLKKANISSTEIRKQNENNR